MDCVLVRKRETSKQLACKFTEVTFTTEGLHIDQNPVAKPLRECVQGMLPLLCVTPGTGGLEVVPGSHSESFRARLQQVYPGLAKKRFDDDWCPLRPRNSQDAKQEFYRELERDATLLAAEPGDMILWDSRTIHGGRVPDKEASLKEIAEAGGTIEELGRLSCTVAMTPRAFAIPHVLQ